jgi:class 3 adenylate cyclase
MLVARGGLGDRERAAALITDAHARFEALGMTPMVERAAALAEGLGIRVPRPGRISDASELAAPDFDVLRRVAQGRGVREIAEALAIAPASAEQRIRALLRKIGARADAPLRERRSPARPAGRPAGRPAHPLVIMFTDIEGSTAAIERLGDQRAHTQLRAHDALLRSALVTHGGAEVSHTGDGMMATFGSASAAIACAVAVQRAVARHSRAHPDLALRVRIGLNAGEPIADEELLFGAAVNLAARVCARAQGGQILVSDVVRQLVAGTQLQFVARRPAVLKGFRGRFRLFEVPWNDVD